MIIRPLQSSEVDAVVDFAIEGMRAETVPMTVSRPKVLAVVNHFAQPNNDFNLLAWDGGHLVAGIAIAATEMLFFERCEAHVVMFRSKAPGVGRVLLRHAMAWCAQDMRIRRVLWSLESDADPRTAKLAERFGFQLQSLGVMHKL